MMPSRPPKLHPLAPARLHSFNTPWQLPRRLAGVLRPDNLPPLSLYCPGLDTSGCILCATPLIGHSLQHSHLPHASQALPLSLLLFVRQQCCMFSTILQHPSTPTPLRFPGHGRHLAIFDVIARMADLCGACGLESYVSVWSIDKQREG